MMWFLVLNWALKDALICEKTYTDAEKRVHFINVHIFLFTIFRKTILHAMVNKINNVSFVLKLSKQ